MSKRAVADLLIVAGLIVAGLGSLGAFGTALADEVRWAIAIGSVALAGLVIAGGGAYAVSVSERRRSAIAAGQTRTALDTVQKRVDPLRDFRQANHVSAAKLDQLATSVTTLEAELRAARGDRTRQSEKPRARTGDVEFAPIEADVAPADPRPVAIGDSGVDAPPAMRSRRVDPDELPEAVWTERYGVASSYTYKLHESKRRRHLLPMMGHRQRVWAFNDKLAGYRFAADHGISSPETIARSTSMADFDWASAPDRFAIKPHNGAANRGVFLLARREDGDYDELLAGRVLSVAAVLEEYAGFVERQQISARFAVEELLAPRPELRSKIDIPDDLKVYCFYDRPVVIMQRRTFGQQDRQLWRFKVWTSDWSDMGPVKYPDRYSSDLERPAGGDSVLAAAERLATSLAVPFIRLDLYDTDRGTVFGEVSPHPGPPEVWDPKVDEFLGQQWEIAEARLLAERIFPSEIKPDAAG
ncbi:MAG: ATP-grasp fold amidoligase family protein [Ilumatobacter sp.]